MSRLLKPKINMPTPPKQKVALTPIGSVAGDVEELEAPKRGKKATILTSNSGLINDPEATYNPSLLG